MTTRQRAQLFHELAKLLGAGLHLDRSLSLLLEQRPAEPLRSWLKGLQRGLANRLTVADAVRQLPGTTPLDAALLTAGERGGRLESACANLASYYDLLRKSNDKALSALLYPLVLLHLGLIVPDVPQIVLGEGASLILPIGMRLAVVWGALALLALVVQGTMKLASTHALADALLNRIPMLGAVRRYWALARFCQVFETGLLAAFRITEALHLAGDACQSALLRNAARRAARGVENGDRLARGLERGGSFPKVFVHSIATAEETGTLDREMKRWATAEAELAAQAQERLAEWWPRIFYVLVLIYVASRIVNMFSGYYNHMEEILDAV
ncbi:MAG: type II secretion system F family protein [Roseimicrobium sp.]